MKIAIIGYGKMGKTIEGIALERGHQIALKVDSGNKDSISKEDLQACDVAIEFSRPEYAIENIKKCIDAKLPIVVGTTGWYDQYESICEKVKQAGSSLLATTNFSVGVNIFFELNRKLAEMMSLQDEYSASITEIHHLQKLDSPSGTAITLAEGLIKEHKKYKDWVNEKSDKANSLSIISLREPEVPGTHTIKYSSDIDEIEITHTAKNRRGFALGAILAAEFIKDKSGIYEMKDLLKP